MGAEIKAQVPDGASTPNSSAVAKKIRVSHATTLQLSRKYTCTLEAAITESHKPGKAHRQRQHNKATKQSED